MDSLKENRTNFIKDLGWYLIGTLIPMGVGFFKTPIFTRYFSPEEYGYLGIITITFSYVSIFVYSWLASCLWRYYTAYKEKSDLKNLYSNLFFIYLAASVLLLVITLIWYFLANSEIVKHLVLLSFVQYLIKEFIGLSLIVVRLEGKAFKYNIIHSTRAILSFLLLYIMTFGFHLRITSVLISTIFIDVILLVVILISNQEKIKISVRKIAKKTLKILFRFGSIGLVTNFCFLLITSSDRYIIALYNDMSIVGIYNQVYNISQLSVVALVTVFFSTISPVIIKELEINFDQSNKMLSRYIYIFILFGLPLITYFSLFSHEIAIILLGEEFRSGYTIMPYIFSSAFLYGLFMFIELKFKFAEKLKQLATGVILASIINIGFNFLLIPRFGYQWAAITTLGAYIFLFLYFFLQDNLDYFKNPGYLTHLLIFILVLAVQIAVDYFIRLYFEINVWQTILEGIMFLSLYLLIMRKQILHLKIPI